MKQKVRIDREDRKVLLALAGVLIAFVLYLGLRPSPSIAESNNQAQRELIALSTDTVPPTQPTSSRKSHETTHKDTLPIRTDRYPGPPQRVKYPSKLQAGATIDLNSADTLLLRRVPGIGESFSRRIYRYRELLGGYYVVEQLQEVYGMDRERYDQIAPFFVIKTAVRPLIITEDSIPRHPYLQFRHQNVLRDLAGKYSTVTWEMLMESGAFSKDDSLRLAPYLVLPNLLKEEDN